jgi:hypothetical protein
MDAPPAATAADLAAEAQELAAALRRRIQEGAQHWFLALLEAIGQWRLPEEELEGRTFRYLIAGEAFDWLLLAERLSLEIADLVPQDELEALLFHGHLPLELGEEEFRRLLGPAKYRAHLNFFYGVLVEEALQLAVEDEVVKERLTCIWQNGHIDDEVCQRIYGATRQELWQSFCQERALPQGEWLDVQGLREFTYWLFRERLRRCDPARVASDTRKGLAKLAALDGARRRRSPRPQEG